MKIKDRTWRWWLPRYGICNGSLAGQVVSATSMSKDVPIGWNVMVSLRGGVSTWAADEPLHIPYRGSHRRQVRSRNLGPGVEGGSFMPPRSAQFCFHWLIGCKFIIAPIPKGRGGGYPSQIRIGGTDLGPDLDRGGWEGTPNRNSTACTYYVVGVMPVAFTH